MPYVFAGQQHHYIFDFVIKVADGRADLLNLIIEVSGEQRPDKDAKVATVKNLWVPAVNNTGQFGRWDCVEITDPYQAMTTIREYLSNAT